jgi:uncharacterized membrane protein YedE/YeeE
MQEDWLWGLAGGGLIGLAAAIFLLVNGRIMGASGIVGEIVDGSAGNSRTEKLWFLAGLIGIPAILVWMTGGADTHATGNIAILIAAGLCVGFGTRLANGCTSGHGICGISRLSLRGIVATILYVLAGGLTVALFRHGLGIL